tara:strand:+ start:929 stop:1198 length:270 start_codon:yes stop_codon:yes gene_type:complete
MRYKFLNINYIKVIIFISFFISFLQIIFLPGIVMPLVVDVFLKDNVELIDQLRKKSSKVCNKRSFLGFEIQSESIIGIICDSLESESIL